jgi:lipid II:glycine glycyltransferase (peptidoglycan interpeptide bridge formation enzyme)
LRVNVELFSPNSAYRKKAGATLAALGFRPTCEPRSYENTLAIDLTPTDETIFAQLHGRARRGVRAVAKRGLEIRPIDDPALGIRMEEIRKSTCDRHGGRFVSREWGPAIDFCRQNPALARLVGLFRTNSKGPDSLLAYAWGLHHIDHAEYHEAASIRDEEMKVPLAYGLSWDLICWAKSHKAGWFDMGGVTAGQFGDKDDPLGGISDFKRFFSKSLAQVGEEWEWEPNPTRAKLARLTSTVARWFARRASGQSRVEQEHG